MQCYCYLFEAKSIQAYLLETNRLREIVGASDLLEQLTSAIEETPNTENPNQESILKICLRQIENSPTLLFTRQGGAAI